MPSIEDLLGKKKKDDSGIASTQDNLAKKMEEIRLGELERETEAKARSLGIEYINLVGFPVSPEAISLIPREQSEQKKVVAFFFSADAVKIGALDPKDPAVDEVKFQVAERSHMEVSIFLISQKSLETALKMYDALPEMKEITKGVSITPEELKKHQDQLTSLKDLDALVQKTSTSDFVSLVIAAALKGGSSDIHIEAGEKVVDIRLRIDGVLNKVAAVDKSLWPRIVNRFKLLSGLKLNITTVPQDGRFTIFLTGDNKVDVRVSTLPTAYGESIVMRLLKSESVGLEFEQLGLRGASFAQLKREVERPNGMIITTGPTGSGKTTTLYAILNKLNDEETKIITLEDPVEFKLKGISQSQIDKSKDYTFAKGLHSILRQDPDVVMVGEIRELETAEVAIQAALTGHLMVSTIHTNSAAGAIPRFLSMGVKPFLLAPALNAVIGQRLIRTIHKDCKVEDTAVRPDWIERAKKILSEISPKSGEKIDLNAPMKWHKGGGCAGCNGLGLKGRLGIYEIMVMTPEIEKVILGGQVSEYDMQRIAVENGMVTMVQDGVLKALDGVTTLEEVFGVAE
jgi:type IV pilus assembly protein PilB